MMDTNTNEVDLVENPQRRKLLGVIVGAINLGLLGAIVGPVLGFIGSPLSRKKKQVWVAVMDDGDLPAGSVREVTFPLSIKDGYHVIERRYSVFLRKDDAGVVCIDPACTHLGCRVVHQSDRNRFLCPCHGGVFDDRGNVVSGPPPKPLNRYPVKIDEGKIWILKDV